MGTAIRGADVISMPDIPLGSNEELTEWSELTSAIPVPSAGAATVNVGEVSDVRCMVLAPRIGTDGAADDCFVDNQDTAPGGGGTFLIS